MDDIGQHGETTYDVNILRHHFPSAVVVVCSTNLPLASLRRRKNCIDIHKRHRSTTLLQLYEIPRISQLRHLTFFQK